MKKTHYYTDIDGDHFPDTELGSELYYTLNYACWLSKEQDDVATVVWSSNLPILDEYNEDGLAHVKVRADKRGTHTLKCTIGTSDSDSREQLKVVNMLLKVY